MPACTADIDMHTAVQFDCVVFLRTAVVVSKVLKSGRDFVAEATRRALMCLDALLQHHLTAGSASGQLHLHLMQLVRALQRAPCSSWTRLHTRSNVRCPGSHMAFASTLHHTH
jgi:hypothetical protein